MVRSSKPTNEVLDMLDFAENQEKREEELRIKIKKIEEKIQQEKKSKQKKLDDARTHAVMSSTPLLVKALGIDEGLNISFTKLKNDEQLRMKLVAFESIKEIFDCYESNVKLAAEFFYKVHPEIKSELQEYIKKHHGESELTTNAGE